MFVLNVLSIDKSLEAFVLNREMMDEKRENITTNLETLKDTKCINVVKPSYAAAVHKPPQQQETIDNFQNNRYKTVGFEGVINLIPNNTKR